MLVKHVVEVIEGYAPLMYQESYDNCGLQVGDPGEAVTGILLCLDVTEAVVQEAIDRGCNMIVSHHPLIFGGLKRVTGRNYVERTVTMAIRNGINILSSHTSLDNIAGGVNTLIAQKLGLVNTRMLAPKKDTLGKLYTYAPMEAAESVREALFAAGAGRIGKYSECGFSTTGIGTFRPANGSNPAIGTAGGSREALQEVKIEVLVANHLRSEVMKALFAVHPYEEVAYEFVPLPNENQEVGAGILGDLADPLDENGFLSYLKTHMKTNCIRHTAQRGKPVCKVAVCGGSGSFLLADAIRSGADVFVTGDFKYHQFFDADGKIMIADIGHFESEQFTPEIFQVVLKENFPNFAILLSEINTNPLQYFY